MEDTVEVKRVNGRLWQPGQTGNPDGRPQGARTKFSEGFYRDLAATWASHGKRAMEETAKLEPAKFVAICEPRSFQNPCSSSLTCSDAWQS